MFFEIFSKIRSGVLLVIPTEVPSEIHPGKSSGIPSEICFASSVSSRIPSGLTPKTTFGIPLKKFSGIPYKITPGVPYGI